MPYKVKDEDLHKICEHLNALLILGVVPGYCMEIIREHNTKTLELEIYDTGNYNFRVKVVDRNL